MIIKNLLLPLLSAKNFSFWMHHIKNMNFLAFCLTLGSRCFVLKHHVNKNIFKNEVGIGYMYRIRLNATLGFY